MGMNSHSQRIVRQRHYGSLPNTRVLVKTNLDFAELYPESAFLDHAILSAKVTQVAAGVLFDEITRAIIGMACYIDKALPCLVGQIPVAARDTRASDTKLAFHTA